MLHRRDFARLALAETPALLARSAPPAPRTIVKPRKLSEGDTVGMIVPATMVFETDIIDGFVVSRESATENNIGSR
jgi:hypothetical protein